MGNAAQLHDKDRFFIGDRSLSLVTADSGKAVAQNEKSKETSGSRSYPFAICILFVVVAALVGSVYWAVQQKEVLPVKRIQVVSKLKHVSQGELQNIIAPMIDSGLLGVDAKQIRTDIEKISWVDSADVRIVWPDGIRIEIKEQAPIARWGSDALLNADGEVFAPKLEKGEFENLAQLNGPKGQQRKVINQYLLFREVLQSRGLQIATITLDERRSWSITTGQGVKLRFGKGEIQQKMSRFLKGYDRKLARQFGQIAYVDLRYTNGFAIKMKQESQPGNKSVKRTYSNG